MNKIDHNDPLSKSTDIVSENIQQLQKLFPEVFKEGKIDWQELQATLGEHIDAENERFNFTWNGKSNARKEAQKPSTGTLRPAPEESVDWDTTQNLYIEGDNLEVLKLLQKSYHQKVKMIYIDPPYNTGKDFVYKDNYKDNLSNYLELTGQKDEDGKKLSTNSDASGRYHSNWLNMMYPRLKLARNLLTEDGVIFISIDDNEVDNLRKICNEIFGEENFVATFQWKRKKEISSDTKNVSKQGEYILAYSKSSLLQLNSEELSKEYISKSYKEPNKEFNEGKWRPVPITVSKGLSGGGYNYEITSPNGSVHKKLWAYPENSYKKLVKDNLIYFGVDGNAIPQKVIYAHDSTGQPTTNYWDNTSSNKEGKKEVLELFEGNNYFDTPKPTNLIIRLIKLASKEDDIILDFFSGSASTAHAVMKLNSNTEDIIKRKHIQVQLPEPTDVKSESYKAGYKTIPEIAKERIRRVGKKITEDHPEKAKDLDLGFKVFKLDSSNIKAWSPEAENLEQNLLDAVENIKEGRTENDLLFEVLLKYGLDLTLPITEHEISGVKVFNVGAGALLVCLADDITVAVAEGIAELKNELKPEICRVVFKDNGFKDSAVKTNVMQKLKQHNIEEVRSI